MNDAIDRASQLRIRSAAAASTDALSERIERLNREWDVDRVLEAEAAAMGLLTLALALAVDRRMLVAPAIVSSMVLLHGVQGWYPLLPVFRRLGFRSRDEIDRERYALKALRGDFAGIPPREAASSKERAAAAWAAVCA